MPIIDNVNFIKVISSNADLLNATPQDVLSGKIFVGSNKKLETGEVTVLSELVNVVLLPDEFHTVSKGYNPSEYSVIAQDLASSTPGTATDSDISEGKTAWVGGAMIVGTVSDIAPDIHNINPGETYNIPPGKHIAGGTVVCSSLDNHTAGNATSEDILKDKIAWVNGNKITGSMEYVMSGTHILDPSQTYTIAKGYHDGNGKVIGKALADNTPGDAIPLDIAEDKIAWVNGKKVIGKVPKIASQTIELSVNGTYTIPAGIHSGTGTIIQNISFMQGQTITPTKETITIPTRGKYLSGDIVVKSVDAYSSKFYNADSENIINVVSTIASGSELSFDIDTDGWHDNNTCNIFKLIINDSNTDNKLFESFLYFNNDSKDNKSIQFSIKNSELFTAKIVLDVNQLVLKITNPSVLPTGITNLRVMLKDITAFRNYS